MEDDTKYVRVDPREHILLRPDLYVGSTVKVKEEQFVLVDGPKIEKKNVTYVPAFLKIFDEVSQSHEVDSFGFYDVFCDV
jgi:DNA topoisomerase-2